MLKKTLSVILALCTACSVLASAAFAATQSSFTDVISPDYDWAVDDIEAMTRQGIIKGYSDHTFRPANDIRKIEMLLLVARAAQFTNDEYGPFSAFAQQLYAAALSKYDLGDAYNRYKPEVAFLLYEGLISPAELDGLIGGSEANAPIKRYEAAVLLTRLLGAEEQVKNNIAPVLEYADYADIPISARAYVEYVTNQGIMSGMEDNSFCPNKSVTRVQVAVILNRVLTKLNYSVRTGTVSAVDPDKGTITLYNKDADGDEVIPVNFGAAKIMRDGITTNIYSVPNGSYALLLLSGDTVTSVEVLSAPNAMSVTDCVITGISDGDGDGGTVLTVKDAEGNSLEFSISPDALPLVTLDGRAGDLNALASGCNAAVTTADGKLVAIKATGNDASVTVTGALSSILITQFPQLGVMAGVTESFYPLGANSAVIVNGSRATIYDLRLNASVELTVENGQITRVDAKIE